MDESEAFESTLASAIATRSPTPELMKLLRDVSSPVAEAAIARLLVLATKWTEGIPIDPLPEWDVGDFVRGFVQCSNFVDHLVDASLLSPIARGLKWDREEEIAISDRKAQLQRRNTQLETSRRHLVAHRRNARAYRNYTSKRRMCSCAARRNDVILTTAHQMVHMPLEVLRMQPPTYWSEVQLDRADPDLVRAVVHKTRLFTERYGASAVPYHTRQTIQYHFDRLATPLPNLRMNVRRSLSHK